MIRLPIPRLQYVYTADLQVNNFFAQPSYVERFGVPGAGANGAKAIPADWQAAINNGQQIGAVAGLAFVGWATDRFGSRKIYMLGMVLLSAASESWILYLPHTSSAVPPRSPYLLRPDRRLTTSLYARLRPEPPDAHDGQHALRFPLGYLPDSHDRLRRRDLPHRHAWILDHL